MIRKLWFYRHHPSSQHLVGEPCFVNVRSGFGSRSLVDYLLGFRVWGSRMLVLRSRFGLGFKVEGVEVQVAVRWGFGGGNRYVNLWAPYN